MRSRKWPEDIKVVMIKLIMQSDHLGCYALGLHQCDYFLPALLSRDSALVLIQSFHLICSEMFIF